MPKRGKRVLWISCLSVGAALIAVAIAASLGAFRSKPEPTYEGRPLSDFVELLGSGSPAKAVPAIRAIGTNAIPYLLEWMRDAPPGRTPDLKARFRQLLRLPSPLEAPYKRKGWRITGAVKALQLLGPDAAQAIPELTRMLNAKNPNDPNDAAYRAARVLPHLGAAALPSLFSLLTNDQHDVRYHVVGELNAMETNSPGVVPFLIELMKGTNQSMACVSARTLGNWKVEPTLAVPALTDSLQDPRPAVRIAAAEGLFDFEGKQELVEGILRTLSESGSSDVRAQASNALQRIERGETDRRVPRHILMNK